MLKDQLSEFVGKKEEADAKIEEYIVSVSVISCALSNNSVLYGWS